MFYSQSHPAQFHKKKQETFFILYGKIKLEIITKNTKKTKILNVGDIITLNPMEIHMFKCISINGCVIEEISTYSDSNDSFYLDQKITRNLNRKSFISLNK